MPIRIRPAKIDDAPAMARVMVDTWLTTHHGQVPEEVWQNRVDTWTYDVSQRGWERTIREIADGTAPDTYIFVAESSKTDSPASKVVGFAIGYPVESVRQTGEIGSLYVSVDVHGQGIGRQLVQTVAAALAERGMTALKIRVLKTNRQAHLFYEAIGGVLTGEIIGGKDGPEIVYGWPDIYTLISELWP